MHNEHLRENHELGIERAQKELDAFAQNPALDELAGLYQVALPEEQSERLHTVAAVGATYWDLRQGASRQETNFDTPGQQEVSTGAEAHIARVQQELYVPGSPTSNTVFEAAAKLDQVESSKAQNQYPTCLLFYGGANEAPANRMAFGLEAVADYTVLVYSASLRTLSDKEKARVADSYTGERPVSNEFDLGCAAIEHLNDAVLVNEATIAYSGTEGCMREYQFVDKHGTPKRAFALGVPTQIPIAEGGTRRADTYDNCRVFAEQFQLSEHPEASVVAVTTGLYVPAQRLVAAEELTLRHGVAVETIGHDAGYSITEIGVERKATQLVQEIKAGVDAAEHLQQAIIAARKAAA